MEEAQRACALSHSILLSVDVSPSRVNQIHFVTSKSGLRKRLQTVDEHSLSLFVGQGCAPPLRGGYRSLTLKSALRADNVYVLPAHYPLRPAASHTHLSITLFKSSLNLKILRQLIMVFMVDVIIIKSQGN